eukprot:gb/GEZN01000423.1/.p1 GENE.gb/GEZN01000423.1/~~gb/GEZN01000423.1/.p1  ORF type:complete len:1362 (-),score=179.26 gb/GEZN01000423.1/:382-4467(-)
MCFLLWSCALLLRLGWAQLSKGDCDQTCAAQGMQGSPCFAGCSCETSDLSCADYCVPENGDTYIYNYSSLFFSNRTVKHALASNPENIVLCLHGCINRGVCVAANCSEVTAEQCDALFREPCRLFEQTCGDCLAGYGSGSFDGFSKCSQGLTVVIKTGAEKMVDLMSSGMIQEPFRFYDERVEGSVVWPAAQDFAVLQLTIPFNVSVHVSLSLSNSLEMSPDFPLQIQLNQGEVWETNVSVQCTANELIDMAFVFDVQGPSANTSGSYIVSFQKRCQVTCLDGAGASLCYRGTCMGQFCHCEQGFDGAFCNIFLGVDKTEYCPGEVITVSWTLAKSSANDWIGISSPWCNNDGIPDDWEYKGCDGKTVEPVFTTANIAQGIKSSEYLFPYGQSWFYLSGTQAYPTEPVPVGQQTISVNDLSGEYVVVFYPLDSYVPQKTFQFTVLPKNDPKCVPAGLTCLAETTLSVSTSGSCNCKPGFFGASCSLGCGAFRQLTDLSSSFGSSDFSFGKGYLNKQVCTWHIKPSNLLPGSKIRLTTTNMGLDKYDPLTIYAGAAQDESKILKKIIGEVETSTVFDATELFVRFAADDTIEGDPVRGLVGFVASYAVVGSCLAGSHFVYHKVLQGSADFNVSTCEKCPAGSFSSVVDSEVCEISSAGFACDTAGLSSCTKCPPGSFSLPNAITCTLCDPGSAQKREGQDSCLLCSAGKAAEMRGASTCTVCERGTVSEEGASVCTDAVSKARKAVLYVMLGLTSVSHLLALFLLLYRMTHPTRKTSVWPFPILLIYTVTSLITLSIPISSLLVQTFPCTAVFWLGALRVHILLAPVVLLTYYFVKLMQVSKARKLLRQEVMRQRQQEEDRDNSSRTMNMLIDEIQRARVKDWKLLAFYGALLLFGVMVSLMLWVGSQSAFTAKRKGCFETQLMMVTDLFFVLAYVLGMFLVVASVPHVENIGMKAALTASFYSVIGCSVVYYAMAFAVGYLESFDIRFFVWLWAELILINIAIRPMLESFEWSHSIAASEEGEHQDLREFVAIARGYEFFLAYCEREFSEENLLCYKQIELYVRHTTLPGLEHIYDNFLKRNSPLQVNISDATFKDFKKQYQKRKKCSMEDRQRMLDAVQHELVKLMQSDTWPRFLTSPLYAVYKRGDQSPHADYKDRDSKSGSTSGSKSVSAFSGMRSAVGKLPAKKNEVFSGWKRKSTLTSPPVGDGEEYTSSFDVEMATEEPRSSAIPLPDPEQEIESDALNGSVPAELINLPSMMQLPENFAPIQEKGPAPTFGDTLTNSKRVREPADYDQDLPSQRNSINSSATTAVEGGHQSAPNTGRLSGTLKRKSTKNVLGQGGTAPGSNRSSFGGEQKNTHS